MIHALSHLEIDEAAAELRDLITSVAGHEQSDPEFIADWDSSTPLKVRAEVHVDLAKCSETADLKPGTGLGLSMLWHASGSRLRGSSPLVPVHDGLNDVALEFDGSELGGTLTLKVVLTLIETPAERKPLAAHRPGSRLWAVERRIRLEGSGSRFPVSHVSFADTGLAGGLQGAWLVHFESRDLFDSGVGNMRLYLNTDHPHVKEYVEDPDQRPDLGIMLRADVNRQVVLQALSCDDLDLSASYPSDSMGELLAMAFRRNFPDRTMDEIRKFSTHAPGEFEAHMQARGGFLS